MSLHEKNYFPIQFENKVYQHNLLGHNPENQECDFKKFISTLDNLKELELDSTGQQWNLGQASGVLGGRT